MIADFNIVKLFDLLGSLFNDSGGQIDNEHIWDIESLGLSHDKFFGQLLTFGFIAAIMFIFDVQIKSAF